MSIADQVKNLTNTMQLDKQSQSFNDQYLDMVQKGYTKPKGYNLAGIDVIGPQKPTYKPLSSLNK